MVPHDSREHPWGRKCREGDPTGDALAGKKGGEAGAVLGADPGDPRSVQQGGPRGELGAGAGSTPSHPGDAGAALGGEPSPCNRHVAHSPTMGVQDPVSEPLRRGKQDRERYRGNLGQKEEQGPWEGS